ncbi:conserved hypothetical protein [Histoplasma mississippiense (nom. inval.)]|uniref:conserved hypothetical protein n=1 Tax=Ajellomyces capsulatus (strain NAm1 / WU24) TaxID=2059318 RepID=UPI000157BE26|nr:conserved hypothetical protein [Histoplasma mississippiense (nom. inval.)]EDN06684.1 conserved hypothetical protein [Histoplasma mississippiense (nom. inval.)]
MAELMDVLEELKALPEQLHMLCPRQNDDDMGLYNDEHIHSLDPTDPDVKPNVENLNRISEATSRRQKFLSSMRLLAFSGDEVEIQQEWIWRRLEHDLEKCDLCIKEYYKGKVWLMDMLGESYDELEVEKFGRIIDEQDIKRIVKNLDRATEILKTVAPQQRSLSVLDRAALLSIFEAMSSKAMLNEDDILRAHFDEPFTLVQSNRTLKMPEYIPATTQFLFDANDQRRRWAFTSWGRMKAPPTTPEFDWAVKEPLLVALRKASCPPVQPDLVRRLWEGIHAIVQRLDKEQITHNLRALEIDPCRLSVDHLAVPTPGLRSLLNTVQIFLEKAPSDFWDAMQTISPQAIIEQIFYNPQFDAFLLESRDDNPFEKPSPLRDMLSWIEPFMASLQGTHQPQACRILVFQLLTRLQDSRFPAISRYICFRSGLSTLVSTLRTFTDNESTRGSVARVVLSDTLEVTSDNIGYFMEPPEFPIEGSKKVISGLCVDVIRNALALECQSLKSDYEVILRRKPMAHGVSTYSAKIWDAVVQHLHEDNLGLSNAALMGILPLVGLEKFSTKGENSKEKTHFNVIYGHLTHLACQILERLADFKPEHLDNLFKSHDTNGSLISALFSADLNTYQAAVDLIKTISGQSGRKEAISHLLQSFCATTMYGFSFSFRRISNMKTFASAPRMLKTGTDIIDVLCDSETGILRTRKLVDRVEAVSLQRLWEYQWQALSTIFQQTETWHLMGNDRMVMLEFCRDTIQFAELLFNQFTIFASSISEFDPSESQSAKENLVKAPAVTLDSMVRWLRLKDDYLATTLVGLVAKLLRRMGELDVTLAGDTLKYIEDVARTSLIKTILTAQEKAELVRALESYYKKPFVTVQNTTVQKKKKQTTITSYAKPIDLTSVSSPSKISGSDEDEFDDIPDEVLMQLSGSVELNKARIAAQKRPEKSAIPSKSAPRPINPVTNVLSFREKREREKEEKKRRDLAELARLKKKLPSQTANQGSGLQGINVNIDERGPVESMMVSDSDSDADSEDSDGDDGDAPGRKATSKPDAVKAYEESRRKLISQRGPVRKVKLVRSAKDMRARLSPDLSLLHRTLLSWEFFANGDLPPNSGRTDYSLVSNTFADAADYQKTFEPLLILEAWQSFQSAKEEGGFKAFEIKVSNRMSVDAFVEVITFMQPTEAKDLGLAESDLVLLSKSNNPSSDEKAPHCLARIFRSIKKKGMMEISYRINPSNPLMSSILPGASLYAARVASLTPVEREYGALMALKYYDLSEEIIKAKPSPILNYSLESLKPIIDTYKVNPAQAKAVRSAMDNDAFTLIQGPPGSGKTKTIVALVGAILTPVFAEQKITRPGSSGDFRPVTRATTCGKLLVCAPSNAAVDELVMRFKEGVITSSGQKQNISVVRLGRSDAINSNVMDVTLDELVNAKLGQNGRKNGSEKDLQTYYSEHKGACTQFNEIRERLDQCRAKGQHVPSELEREFDLLKRKKAQLSQAIDNARDSNQAAARNADLARKKVQQEIINGSHVICATLSGSGHEMFQSLSIEFETVVIDEAAQSIELSALIPLKYGCSKCILVGDPKQLPPTVLSKVASRFQYEQSLFVRMQANHPKDVHLLDTQYRMHPEISRFPSAAFYDGRLKDGPDMAKLRVRPWHSSELLGPYRFFDVQGLHSSAPKSHSLVNLAELRVAMKLYERLTIDYLTYDFKGKIGIITPYKGQLREMKNQFANKYGSSIFTTVEFNTTDAFQGRECEVIIFSCVRASNRGIGFLADIRRMNVGLTRAKSSLWVLGNSQSLVQGEFWNGLITDAQSRNLYTQGDILKLLQRPQISLDMELKDVQMIDAPSAKSSPPSRNGSMTPGWHGSSRPSSALSTGRVSSTHPASSRDTPGHSPTLVPSTGPEGPSGGKFGLNDLAMCGFCGSYEHMTTNCDNAEAKMASHGACWRCGDVSHSKRDCKAERCLRCGAFGHSARQCTSTVVLSKQEKDKIARDEHHHAQAQKANIERQRQKQLGDHDPKVPVIQVPSKVASNAPSSAGILHQGQGLQDSPNADQGNSGKRKRMETDLPSSRPNLKVRKPNAQFNAQFAAPLNAPKGPRGKKLDPHIVAPPTSDLVIPSKSEQGHQPIASKDQQLSRARSGTEQEKQTTNVSSGKFFSPILSS